MTFLYVRIFFPIEIVVLEGMVYRNFPAQPYVQTNLGKAWVCLCPAMCTGGDGKKQRKHRWAVNDIGLVFTGFHTGLYRMGPPSDVCWFINRYNPH